MPDTPSSHVPSWGKHHRRRTARRVLLGFSALVFLLFGLAGLFAPQRLAGTLDYTLTSTNAFNDFRAVYGGLCLAACVVFGWAARRIDVPVLADAGGLMYLGLAGGRLVSFAADGLPGAVFIGAGAVELTLGVAILALRPAADS